MIAFFMWCCVVSRRGKNSLFLRCCQHFFYESARFARKVLNSLAASLRETKTATAIFAPPKTTISSMLRERRKRVISKRSQSYFVRSAVRVVVNFPLELILMNCCFGVMAGKEYSFLREWSTFFLIYFQKKVLS